MPVHPDIFSEAALRHVHGGAKKPPGQMTADELPPMAVSWATTEKIPVGTWKAQRPLYQRGLSPCLSNCPVGNDVEGYVSALRDGDEETAIKILAAENPFPAVCGRVCYHPCETACNRTKLDGAVGIRGIERYLGDLPFFKEKDVWKPVDSASNKKIAVIGSGPSGLAAAWALSLLGHKASIFEKQPEPGGLLLYGIPEYRLPKTILSREIHRLRSLGIEFYCNTEVGPVKDLVSYRDNFDAVFVATGAVETRSLGLDSENNSRVFAAIEFLSLVAMDKQPEIGFKAVVIGGGNSAIDAARSARRLGAESTILYRRTRAEMPAYEEEIKDALGEGVQLHELAIPISIEIKNGKMTGVRCLKTKLGEPDDSGRRSPVPVPGSDYTVPADSLINAAGEMISRETLVNDPSFQEALANIDPWGESGVEGMFAGGDFAGSERTVAHAIGSGKRAAMAIDKYLRNKKDVSLDRFIIGGGPASFAAYIDPEKRELLEQEVTEIDFEKLNPVYYAHHERLALERDRLDDIRDNFEELEKGFNGVEALEEAGRCFSCGRCTRCGLCQIFCPEGAVKPDPESSGFVIMESHCKGCGICVEECPRCAIKMELKDE